MIHRNNERGFTLVEMIVAVGLFAVVMVVCVAALLALVGANRKAQALQSVMNNLNVSLDGMARAIRMGNTYYCGAVSPYTGTRDCTSDDGLNTMLVFEHFGGSANTFADQWIYFFDAATHSIKRTQNGNLSEAVAITAPEVSVDDMRFYVVGSTPGDTTQPKVIVIVKGTAGGTNVKTRTSFHIQVGAVQRMLDL